MVREFQAYPDSHYYVGIDRLCIEDIGVDFDSYVENYTKIFLDKICSKPMCHIQFFGL